MAGSVCIITARGGSKRIPRKNVREFCGKPMLAYSVECALESGIFDTVMVSTDDAEIAEVARAYGAEVPFMRSEATSNDYATTADVLREVLDEYKARGTGFDTMCCLYPTAPFVRASELKEAAAMIEAGATSVIPVTSFDFPPLRGFKVGEDGSLAYAFPEYAMTRSQDLPEMVHDCGRFYFANTCAYLEQGAFAMPGCKPLFIDPRLVQDIDDESDWALAETKYKEFMKGEPR